MSLEPTVFVVDDDPAVRESLQYLIESVGLNVESYPNAQTFTDAFDPAVPGCLVLDVRMPGASGLDLLDELKQRKVAIPPIIITGTADVPMAVRAMKVGAVDFIEKPFNDQLLLDRIQRAIEEDRLARTRRDELQAVITRRNTRTRR